jgi:uncharacterized DUF497 family protein
MRFVWDDTKRQRNIEVHGLDFADVEGLFDFEHALIGTGKADRDGRPRFKAIGRLHAEVVVLVFGALGAEAISLTSLGPASRKERKLFDERQAQTH